MIGYNPSHLNKNETLLEAFHRVEAYLKANPQYQVYQSSAQYQDGTQEYTLNTIIVPEGSKVSVGDVVFFSNSYYAVIAAVYELTFSVETAVSFRGPQGPKGDKGDRGTGGAGSNPNLLINPNFAINQRGQTSYTGAVYGVDRWKGYQLNAMVCTPNTNGVTLTAPESSTGTGAIYRQIIEPEQVARLAGKTITFSFMATNRGSASIYMRCLTPASAGDTPSIASGETKIVTKTITLAADITELQFVFRKGAGTLDVDINWAKVEIGSVATEFSPPSIAEELPKCQRYYQIRSNSYTIEANAIDRPIPMRANGTIGTTTINSITYNYVDAEI